MTWLQRQQQKLRERREAALRIERRPQEVRLLTELKSQYHHRPSASHRDGYTSDTTHFADDDEDDDDDDLSIPLHVQTSPTRNLASAPVSPLPRRGYQNGVAERPFVQVKRTHETRKYAIDSVSFQTISFTFPPDFFFMLFLFFFLCFSLVTFKCHFNGSDYIFLVDFFFHPFCCSLEEATDPSCCFKLFVLIYEPFDRNLSAFNSFS